MPTFDEVLAFARRTTTCDGEPLGVIPEIKHSTYLAAAGLPAEQALLDALAATAYAPGHARRHPELRGRQPAAAARMTRFDLVQLVDCAGAPTTRSWPAPA